MRITRRSAAMALALCCAACSPQAPTSSDAGDIEALMRATWDRPEQPLDVGPIAIEHGYAVADWTQGDMGGRALLHKRSNRWTVVLCAGDAIRSAAGLRGAGVPPAAANALARNLAEHERGLDSARLAAMSRFAQVVRMPTNGGTSDQDVFERRTTTGQ